MDFQRRNFISLCTVVGMSMLSGCLTTKLFEPSSYKEEVSSVLISEDKKNLVVITKDFHYIFKTTPEILESLKEPLHKLVWASFSNLYVKTDNTCYLKYIVTLEKSASDSERKNAIKAGFVEQNTGSPSFSGELEGIRYSSGGIHIPESQIPLNKVYKIKVITEQSSGVIAAKTLLSPVTVSIDGVLMVGAVVLAPFAIVVMGVLCDKPGGC